MVGRAMAKMGDQGVLLPRMSDRRCISTLIGVKVGKSNGLKASTYAERFRGPAGFPTECLAPPAVGAFTQTSGGFAALNGSNVNEGLTETVMLLSLFK